MEFSNADDSSGRGYLPTKARVTVVFPGSLFVRNSIPFPTCLTGFVPLKSYFSRDNKRFQRLIVWGACRF